MFLGEKVHRAAPPFAAAGFLAEQLTHHLAGRYAGTEGVHVIAVGAAEPVVLTLHRADDAGADGLLAVVEVHKPEHLAPVVHLGAFVLEAAPEGHVLVEGQAGVAIHRGSGATHQIGETFGVRTGGRAAGGGGIDRKVLTHDRPNNWKGL